MLKSTEKGTFLVRILDQQHNSWQGTVTWLADDKKETFRSLLELITIIGNELEPCQIDDETTAQSSMEEVGAEWTRKQRQCKSASGSMQKPGERRSALKILEPAV